MAAYVPNQGDLVSPNFDPQAGHVQKGRAMCCPITNTDCRVPFHVPIAGRTSLTRFVVCEQVKSLEFRSRQMELIERAPGEVLDDVLPIIDASLFPGEVTKFSSLLPARRRALILMQCRAIQQIKP